VFPVVDGTEYEIAVDGFGGAYGSITLSLNLVVPPAAPILALTRSNGQIVLSWGTNWTGYVLESAKSLAAEAPWDQVSPAPLADGTNYVVTNAMTRPAFFYRLRPQ
jgi:hypothetical protein